MFYVLLLYVHSSIAIILMGKRELVALLNLSSWCLVMVERLFLAVPRGCLQFVIVVFPDHTNLLFMKSMQLQMCRLLLTFANSLEPDQAQHNFQSKSEKKMFDTQMVFLIIIFTFEKTISEEDNNKMIKNTQHAKS